MNSLLGRMPAAPEVVAFVRLSETTEPVPCLVSHGLADALPTGTRDEATAETVMAAATGTSADQLDLGALAAYVDEVTAS